ncbi:uncharacterized protein JCM6883_007193 [Sporobolomyces salmoneus]|uniref:uncharacterized protein n=1 Tax=Sporobolomyces salmoneus TaxID=183962 RepID=UPI00316C65F4
MTRAAAPPYLRAQSSPTLPPPTPSPTSSTFIGATLRPKTQLLSINAGPSGSVGSRIFQEQSIPVFVVDDQTLEVIELNQAARKLFGLETATSISSYDAGKNEREMIKEDLMGNSNQGFFGEAWIRASRLFKTCEGNDAPSSEDRVRDELQRLHDLCSARQKRGVWGQGEKTLMWREDKEWEVEVVVRKFLAYDPTTIGGGGDERDGSFPTWIDSNWDTAPSTTTTSAATRGDWYEVTLLRPWQDHMAAMPAVRGPLKTEDVLERVPHVRSELSAASLPNPHIAAPDVDPSILPNLVPSSSHLSSTNSAEVPDSPMRRKDSYYSDRTPTLGTTYNSGNLFGNTWSHNASQRSASSSSKTASTPGTGGGTGSWEYAKPFGWTVTEEQETSCDAPQSDALREPPSNSQECQKADHLAINGQDHFDPTNPFPLGQPQQHPSLPPAALNAANSKANSNCADSSEPRSDGTDGTTTSSSSSGQSIISFDQSAKSNSTKATSIAGTGSNSREVSPGGNEKPKTSPTAAAALRPGGPTPVLPTRLQGMGISVSSAGIQLSQSIPIDSAPRSKSDSATPVTTSESLSTPVSVPLSSPSLTTPTSTSSPLPFSSASTQPPTISARLSRPHPLSLSRTNLSDSSNGSNSSHATTASFPLGSPRPTALPPLPPKSPNSKPDPTALLQFSALANLPKTGVIISDPEVASGYVNALAREILMGVPAVDSATPDSPMSEDLPEEWWNFGHWSVDDEPWSSVSGASGSVNSSTSGPFFSGVASPAAVDRSNPFEAKDLMYSAIIAAGEAVEVEKGRGTAGTGLRIGKPVESNRFRTTVAGILARSLVGNEKRKVALRGEKAPSRGSPNLNPISNPQTSGLKSPGGQSNGSGQSGQSGSASSRTSSSTQIPAFIAAGGVGAQGRKPYKVFDQSFSQRVIDPFEPLIEMCARRGEQAPTMDEDEEDEYDRATNGMIVGIEVEVWEAAADSKSAAERSDMKTGSFVTSNVPAMQLRKKRVRRRIIEVSAAPLFAPSRQGTKQHLGGVLLLRDITDDQRRLGIREAPTQLKKKGKGSGETYFKQILDNMPQMVWTTTPRGSHSYFNKLWYEYTGLEPEQSLGLGWQSPFHEDDMPGAMKAWSRSLETGEPYSVEYRCRRFDGTWRWMLGRALPFRDADGKIQGWFGTCTDFDELYKMREQLRRTLQQNAAVVQGASCLLLAIDREGIITYLQGAQKASLLTEAGITGEAEGHHISAIKPTEEFMEIYRRVIDGEAADRTLTWITSKKGLCFRCLLTPLTETRADDSPPLITGCIVVAHDITDLVTTQTRLKQSYEERAKLQASETAATEASRLKSEFLALTSHELRTPIAHMLGLSELLLSEPLSDSQKSLAAQILRSGDVLLEMIGQVLDMGKVEAGKLDLESRPFNLNDLSSDARLFSTAASKKGLDFVEEIDQFSTEVLGDMPRLRQVLTNLLSNAVKFTKKGSITLRIQKLSEDDKSIKVRWEVQDTGVGIKREAISSLFKPFHQADVSTSRQFGGTGLGLSISKNLIELMGGNISLTSDYGVGTKMSVELRLEKASDDSLSQSSSNVPKAVQDVSDVIKENTWILVVDDNELNRSIIARLLTKMGFNVECAANGYEALDMVSNKRYDLVLMDHQMDGMDGLETTVKMRQSENVDISGLKIIALTASALKGDQEKFIASGADGYLSKPVRSAVLEATILKALAPKTTTRQSSSTNTPNEESAAKTGFDFGGASKNKIWDPSQPPQHVDDHPISERRRPSYPSYGSEAAL